MSPEDFYQQATYSLLPYTDKDTGEHLYYDKDPLAVKLQYCDTC